MNASDNAYVTGTTDCADFPVTLTRLNLPWADPATDSSLRLTHTSRHQTYRHFLDFKAAETPCLMDVIDEIAIHLTNRSRAVSLSEAAGFAHVTPNYLCRIFKEHTGDSPMGYLQTVRMREAEKLLSFTDLPVYTKWSRFHPKLRG